MAKKAEVNPTAGTNVDVTPGHPLYITDSNRTFDTVTIFQGGQVFVQTSAPISIQHLIKKTS